VRIFVYAGDIDNVGRPQATITEAFISLEKAVREMHLQINQEKTKYMPVTKGLQAQFFSYTNWSL
jgi:hypothetical protein